MPVTKIKRRDESLSLYRHKFVFAVVVVDWNCPKTRERGSDAVFEYFHTICTQHHLVRRTNTSNHAEHALRVVAV
jgi:hypothetical protein